MGNSDHSNVIVEGLTKPYNLIFLSSVVILTVAGIIFMKVSKDKNYNNYNICIPIFKKGFDRNNAWLKTSIFWMVLEYSIVIISFECSLIVVFISAYDLDDVKVSIFYAVLAMALIAFSFAINPKRHQKCYRKAYEILDFELSNIIVRYNLADDDEKKKLEEGVANAINKGEKVISQSYDIDSFDNS